MSHKTQHGCVFRRVRGQHVHRQAQWSTDRRALGGYRLGRRQRLGDHLRRRRHPEQLYGLWDGAVERSRARLNAALANGGLDQSVHFTHPDGRHASLRRLVCDLIEEYGRHTGHADLIREAVDGRVGEDPPAGWRPKAGHYRVDG
jgi:hypothetical protein